MGMKRDGSGELQVDPNPPLLLFASDDVVVRSGGRGDFESVVGEGWWGFCRMGDWTRVPVRWTTPMAASGGGVAVAVVAAAVTVVALLLLLL